MSRVLTPREKKQICHDLYKIKRRDILIVFKNTNIIGDMKSIENVEKILHGTTTNTSKITYMTLVEVPSKNRGEKETHMAVKIETKNAISLGTFISKMYKLFPSYHDVISCEISCTSTYLGKARTLVSPIETKEIDTSPYVYGESLTDLLKRIENSAKGEKTLLSVSKKWTPEIIQACRDANGSWSKLTETSVFKEQGMLSPYQFRTAFDAFSGSSGTVLKCETSCSDMDIQEPKVCVDKVESIEEMTPGRYLKMCRERYHTFDKEERRKIIDAEIKRLMEED